MMNGFDILPLELWELILMNLTCKEILHISDVSPQFKEIIEKNNIFEKRKYLGFPRPEGHCYSHDVSGSQTQKIYIDDMSSSYYLNELDKMLDYLYDRDLVRGDLIMSTNNKNATNAGIFIFDGHKITYIEYKLNVHGYLPYEFNIIENDVPPLYWSINALQSLKPYDPHRRGINCNRIVWFDHVKVQDQCIKNVSHKNIYDEDGDLECYIFTTFIYNNKSYKIRYRYSQHEDNDPETIDNINNFIKILSTKNKLLLTYNLNWYSAEFDHDTLFLSMDMSGYGYYDELIY